MTVVIQLPQEKYSGSGRRKNFTALARRSPKSLIALRSARMAFAASLAGMMSHSRPATCDLRSWMQARATEYRFARVRRVSNEASLIPSLPGVPTGRFHPTWYW